MYVCFVRLCCYYNLLYFLFYFELCSCVCSVQYVVLLLLFSLFAILFTFM